MDFMWMSHSSWLAGLVLVASGVIYLFLRPKPVKAFWAQTIRSRKDSTSKTPPRSISPENTTGSTASHPYTQALPPSRRQSLAGSAKDDTRWHEASDALIQDNLLPMAADYRTSPRNRYTPTGFSVEEIKTLADFPDYAKLSGVPLPSPYLNHDINRACPRPYRPFRWAYHQTMCTISLSTTHPRKY